MVSRVEMFSFVLFGPSLVVNFWVVVNVLATAIMARMTVDELAELQLAYVPQFGSAKDAVNMAGYVASNIWHGDAPTTYWDTAADPAEKILLLDLPKRANHLAKHIVYNPILAPISITAS